MCDEAAKTDKLDPKAYLEYLDKEMTIMSVLSTVAVLATGGILNSLLTTDKGVVREVWAASHKLILSGSTLSIIAGMLFYAQRSKLAWHYGQICLAQARNDQTEMANLLDKADSWAAWWRYSWGWTCLITGLIGYLLGLANYERISGYLSRHQDLVIVVGLAVASFICGLQYYVLKKYPSEDRYWRCFWNGLKNSLVRVGQAITKRLTGAPTRD